VVADDNFAYVTLRAMDNGTSCGPAQTNSLLVLDIKNLAIPKLLSTYQMRNPYGLGIDGKNLFICEGESGLKRFNRSENFGVVENMLEFMESVDAFDVIPHDNVLIVTGKDGIYQFDYSESKEMKLLSKIPKTKF
ncbi:MAG: hypothetical protein H7Y04_11680, partial [Verrucomicrobia bacterium]|nr:hypothetical protein [Cytophagales bacterium]